MTRTTPLLKAATLSLLVGASACSNEELFRPLNFTPVDPLFERYVSLGNSITAGYQSDGINDSTQLLAYPVFLANVMRSPFYVPLMNRPGCPPPLTNVYLGTRVPPAVPNNCALRRIPPIPPPFISNVAVPDATVLDGYTNLDPASSPNGLTTFFLGGLTQTQMMQRADPTFVTVWLGNNDVLRSVTDTANAGRADRVTDTTVFRQRYQALLDSIDVTRAQGNGILLGVASVTLIPYLTKGSKFYNVKYAGDSIPGTDAASKQFPANFLVDPNCAPPRGDSIFVPFRRGAAVVAFARANPATTVGVDCNDIHNVSPAEFVNIFNAVQQHNVMIAAEAGTRGYVFADPNEVLAAVSAAIPAFPNIPTVPPSPAFAAAATTPFGTYFSLDGVHPSTTAHKLIANSLVTIINGAYGTSLPAIP
jgi:hypothetical protein